jgi:transcriptional regulator with XRE-family HTH domain
MTTPTKLIRAVGRRICTLRELRGLTQRQLSDRAGVGHAELSKIENGQRAASLITLDAIARGLQSSLTVLLDHEQPLDDLRGIEGALTLLRDAEPAQRDKAIRVINAILIASAETPVSRHESGARCPSVPLLARYAEVLEVPIYELLRFDEPGLSLG